jgi:hypothetical protein
LQPAERAIREPSEAAVSGMPAMTPARRLWHVIEPVHAVLYFAPELRAAAIESGLAAHGSTYFACRAAPLGRATAALVTAVFFGFSPARVSRAVPGMWELVDPAAALALRTGVADAAIRRLLGSLIGDPKMRRAAELASRAVDGADLAGRPLAASNAELAVPDEAHLRLWQALTTLREHRGDGHVAALLTAGVDPCAAHVLRAGSGAAEPEFLRTSRGWSEPDWAEATERARSGGWLADDGSLTASGRRLQEGYEADTDRLAARPFEALGPQDTAELEAILRRLATAVVTGGGVPVHRGLGSPWPPPA